MRVLFYNWVCCTHTCVNTVRTLPLYKRAYRFGFSVGFLISRLKGNLTLSRLGKHLVSILESSAHKSAYSGPINMIPTKKWICYVLPIHVACSIMQIGPLVPKLQQVTGLCDR